MPTYLVGGFVRDTLMGLYPNDHDYVVVGSTPEGMLSLGFKQVGADFPVFLNYRGDEYALARTERKTGSGYGGFDCEWEGVTLEEDLSRRDLTINSIAKDEEGNLIDPFNGQQDIRDKVLRHTSDAFAEDPVRVLRVARFLARFGPEWSVAPETKSLCIRVWAQDSWHLTKERVFKEMEKALSEPHPHLFFEFLSEFDLWWFPSLWIEKGVPQPPEHHPEGDVFTHTMLCLQEGVKLRASDREQFAILCHDLGKPVCWEARGNLHGHEKAGLPHVEALCDKLGVPKAWRDLALKVCEWHQYSHKILDVAPKKVHKLIKALDCVRKPDILHSFLKCNIADARGRTEKFHDRPYPQADYLRECLSVVREVDCGAIWTRTLREGKSVELRQEAIRVAQIYAIRGVKN